MSDKTAEQLSAQAAHDVAPVDLAASQLSAMVDGELADAEMNLALRRLSRDHDTQGRWERYHLISDALQGHLPAAIDTGISPDACARRLSREPLPQSAAKPLPAWYKPVTGFGLAASVVLTALFGLQLTRPDAAFPPEPQIAAAPAASIATPLPATGGLSLNPPS
ncbi:MAG: sigma-E factor negative regulatory protein [Candidatus Competibacteraceae bacterium]|nr:sigma-E factor negative regulatory protein [Candidatus Competibacteraceae bacterium]